ncbi:hypothetical protein PNOK_0480300 [Pyrrhoderma noxium]|uniref:Uncharacterized protein n=1 Tax=Pyrrhoderma noxium TaxID=2282107 RepID=A0A286UK15_9AGAM|nr:hypothetical protein PNOK_0480300 [Pyrrhoderma noxium]
MSEIWVRADRLCALAIILISVPPEVKDTIDLERRRGLFIVLNSDHRVVLKQSLPPTSSEPFRVSLVDGPEYHL